MAAGDVGAFRAAPVALSDTAVARTIVPIRRPLTIATVLTMVLLLVAGPATAQTVTTTRGTAQTTSIPLQVDSSTLAVDLGANTLLATTDSDVTALAPWSRVQLTLADVAGATFGDFDVRSDGTTTDDGAAVAQGTPLGAVGATATDLLAVADDTVGSASSSLTTLAANATVLQALEISATISNVLAEVDDTGAGATHDLAVAAIDLDLAHVLGGVLATLPLEDLIALADELGITVPVNLDPVTDVVAATEALLTAVAAAVEAAADVATAAAALDAAEALDPLAAYGDITALGTLVSDLEALDPVADLAGALTFITTVITTDADYIALGCGVAVPALDLTAVQTAIAEMIACIEAHLDTYAAALAALADELTALEDAVTAYIDAVAAAATAATDGSATAGALSVSDIVDDIQALLDDLLAFNLMALGPIEVSQQVRAIGSSLEGSSASHACSVTTIAAVGGAPVEITDCEGSSPLTAAITTITTTLSALLDVVGGVDAGDGVSLELFGTSADAVSQGADGYVRASSVLEVLALTIPSITVTACDIADGLVCALGIDIDGTLADVLATLADALTDAQVVAEDAVTAVTDILDALGASTLLTDVTGVDAAGAQALVDAAVTALTAVLDSLLTSLGDLGTGGGLTVPGIEVTVDPELDAEHLVTVATVEAPAPTPDGGDDPNLPNTGGGAALLAVLAIGAGAWLWRARRRDA